MSTPQADSSVTVAGAGRMGSALARAFLSHGHHVTVWNRTAARAQPLRQAGATLADSLVDAVGAAEVTVMCVAHQAAAAELLAAPEVQRALEGKTLVQLTTGTPADARRGQAFAQDHGITYLDGAIMAYPRIIGTDAAPILFSGPADLFAAHEALLGALGTARYLGEEVGRAATVDAALIAFFYGTLTGFFHGARLALSEGMDAAEYLEIARTFFATGLADAVEDGADRVLSGNYSDAQSSMDTHLDGINLLVLGASRDAGIDAGVMAAIRDLFAQATTTGRGQDDIACLIDLETDAAA